MKRPPVTNLSAEGIESNLNCKLVQLTKLTAIVAVIIIIYGISSVSCNKSGDKDRAPKFVIELYRTKDYEEGISYLFDPKGNPPLIINFWFPSCPPCIAEMPEINSIYRKHKDRLDVVGIQLIGLDSLEDGQKFVTENDINYAVGPDIKGEIAVDYGVSVFPTTFFIDARGDIFKTWQGSISRQQMDEVLDHMLSAEEK